MRGVAWTQVSPRSTEANKISDLPRHSSPATRNPAKKTDRSYCNFCHRGSSSRTAHTRGFHNRQAFRTASCPDQTGFACAGLRKQMRDPPVRELPFPSAAHANISDQESALSASVPAGPVLLDELSWQPDPVPWSGSLGRVGSSFSGRTDSIHDSDSDRWKLRREADAEWSQSSASAWCLPQFLVCAPPLALVNG